ncbi:PAAR domain-containing protein [Burkholderia metallica]|uniref:PAAR domain-containing protein n=1 Tax=Burkholderia metallica TaxID=488729 RepID=UPI001CF53952|nr:PAAR domain-containing protein [Burkholderia metallica]MCA8003355.1 PAAR domain-containing protein [Burkholderia metallica]
MPNVIYVGDATSHGGKVLTGSSRVKLHGRGAARKTDKVSCPRCGDNEIVEGNARMRDGDLPLSFHGHKTRCGATLIASSKVTGCA